MDVVNILNAICAWILVICITKVSVEVIRTRNKYDMLKLELTETALRKDELERLMEAYDNVSKCVCDMSEACDILTESIVELEQKL